MKALSPEEIAALGHELCDSMAECTLCPMECGVNRLDGELGECLTGPEPFIASWDFHFGEEPPLVGSGGSGTIFMGNCNLACKYCQNYRFSQEGEGYEISVKRLAEIMLELQETDASNINLVTPSHQVAAIVTALGEAKKAGLTIPVVYNCSGYEKVGIIRKLAGIIDIYLVDMRYNSDSAAREYSGCENYVATNRAAVKEMYRQVGDLVADENGLAVSGLMVRHLVLPNDLSGSEGIFKFLAEEVSQETSVSLMSQYHPAHRALADEKINRGITREEFAKAKKAFYKAGLENGHTQDLWYEKV